MAIKLDGNGFSLPSLCGPSELAELGPLCRKMYARDMGGAEGSSISESGQARLIELCYAASLLKEEGKHVLCTVHVPSAPPTNEFKNWIVWLKEPLCFDSGDVLRKIGPASLFRKETLVADEKEQQLRITGFLKIRKGPELGKVGSPLDFSHGAIRGQTVAILGPGHLILNGPHPPIELRGGKIFSNYPYVAEYPLLQDRFNEVASAILGSTQTSLPAALIPVGGPRIDQRFVTATWQQLIQGVQLGGHGGAFVVCTPESTKDILIKHEVQNLDVGSRLRCLWDKCFDDQIQFTQSQFREWSDARVSLHSATDMLVGFASIDGCVVLDERFNVLGFGAKLKSPHAKLADLGLRGINPFNGRDEPQLEDTVKRFGTRHSSAFYFCAHNPGTMAFVISQDGDVRAFVSDGTTISLVDCTSLSVLSLLPTWSL